MVERYLVIGFLLLLVGCTPSPLSQETIAINTSNLSQDNITVVSNQSTVVPPSDTLSPRLLARGGGIFNFSELTAANCEDYIFSYRALLDDEEELLKDLERDLRDTEEDLQLAETALSTAQRNGDDRAVTRAREDIDDAEDEVTAAEDLVDTKTEYLRKLKLVFTTMKDECPKLRAKL